ncbi:MAG: rRNA maturation RNase YbeY [Candidatus Levybacteria bacterium RIFCSPHIGHO2_01_FULL_38_26]|nr:MAG: rRNA maturation RNase YbeY [Candidatus Levybacteria bacterium RIFCSPHIGHO2_01_FULL_38_26]
MNITIPIFVESRYKVNKKRIRGIVDGILKRHGINGPLEVSIAIIGDRKMRLLSKKYKGEDKTRNVLSFSLTEGDSSYLPKEILRLGDIVISYPQVIKESAAEEMLVDDKIDQLVEHGLGHLLGMNHK